MTRERSCARRALVRGALLALLFALIGLAFRGAPGAARVSWIAIGLATALPAYVELHAVRGGALRRVPPLEAIALVFASSFVAIGFAVFQGLYVATLVKEQSVTAAWAALQDLGETLALPYRAHAFWDALFPWHDLWRWWNLPHCARDTTLALAATVTLSSCARWAALELERRGRPGATAAVASFAAHSFLVVVVSAIASPGDPPYAGRFTSAQGLEEHVAFLGAIAVLAAGYRGVAVVAERIEEGLAPGAVTEPVSSPRFSWGRALLLVAAAVVALARACAPEPGLLAKTHPTSVAFSPDGRLVAYSDGDGDHVLAVDGGHEVARTRAVWGQGGTSSVGFSPDGRRVTSVDNGRARLWRLADGGLELAQEHDAQGIAFVGTGAVAIVTGREVRVWSVADMALVHVLWRPGTDGNSGLGCAVAGDRVAVPFSSTGGRVWDAREGKLLWEERRLASFHVSDVALSPDGALTAWAADAAIDLRDAATGKRARVIGAGLGVTTVAFSPDGRRIVGGCHDRKLRVVEVATGKVLATFEGHREPPRSVAWSPRGDAIVSCGMDGVRLFRP